MKWLVLSSRLLIASISETTTLVGLCWKTGLITARAWCTCWFERPTNTCPGDWPGVVLVSSLLPHPAPPTPRSGSLLEWPWTDRNFAFVGSLHQPIVIFKVQTKRGASVTKRSFSVKFAQWVCICLFFFFRYMYYTLSFFRSCSGSSKMAQSPRQKRLQAAFGDCCRLLNVGNSSLLIPDLYSENVINLHEMEAVEAITDDPMKKRKKLLTFLMDKLDDDDLFDKIVEILGREHPHLARKLKPPGKLHEGQKFFNSHDAIACTRMSFKIVACRV